ncbi:MAG TPA: ribonuclease H-like domain-containing protein [Dehalococcoidales bacterium]|nr:ribonuclease H-like domain-containing protein [Dehalococcoidales bacterium]
MIWEAYLDIETTGLSPEYCQVTVVGIYVTNGLEQRLVQIVGDKINSEAILKAMEGVDLLYTYNGRRFDLPFIAARHGINLEQLFIHHDLMQTCWRNNLFGGLKKVEQCLGIDRNLKEVNGQEAVRLWWRYVNDYDEEALKILLEYNKEDVINLKILKDKILINQPA